MMALDLASADRCLAFKSTPSFTCRTREKNRVAQRRFRDRQKEKDKEKERKLADMTRRLSELTHEKVSPGCGCRRSVDAPIGNLRSASCPSCTVFPAVAHAAN